MPASALAHAPGHVQGTSHHHDDDGSVHYDDSDESIQHAQDHSACQPNFALPSVTIASLNFVRSTAVPALPGNVPSEVFLERPQRPPAVPG